MFIASLAVLIATAFVPTAPAQLPELPPDVVAVLCDTAPDVAALLGVSCGADCAKGDGTFSASLTATASGNSISDPDTHHWAFCGAEGDEIYFEVDNVDTAADLWACVSSSLEEACPPATWTDPSDLSGDDEMGCTVPHFYGCPVGNGVLGADADGDGIYYIHVGTWANPGGYAGLLTVNENGVTLTQTE